MGRRALLGLVAAGSVTLAVSAGALATEPPPPLKTAQAGNLGTILTGPNGMTLYVFTEDTAPGKSSCNGICAQHWPPFTAGPNDPPPKPPLSVIVREDGTKQYAYDGKPLYFWSKDRQPGDVTAYQFSPEWLVAHPEPTAAAAAGLKP